MALQFELSTQQIKDMASYFSSKDIKDFVENHPTEYEQFLNEEEKAKKFTHFSFQNTNDNPIKIRKKYDTNYYTIWTKNNGNVVCNVITNKMKGCI